MKEGDDNKCPRRAFIRDMTRQLRKWREKEESIILAGDFNDNVNGKLKEALRDVVAPKFAEALGESGTSVLDLVSNYSELGNKISPLIQEVLTPFGIELTKFQISSTGLPKEVEAFYDKMTNMNMVDNMNKFNQFQSANAIEKAADNPGGAGEGMGMGMGFGMAQMMMNQQNQMQQNNDSSNPKKETKEEILKTLKELGDLKSAGILTDEEFEAKKKDLLSRL